ncbi:LysM peptidoglycan-binding domain-containing protein [Conexibacter sp. SYSU D00693]|uniref:lytic transglycosylase n=1 Tax=Conexibacter sp. SYSU D00693 TaxID=2812560 RepID=UPI00196BAC6B|nr:LysM peptidoglycan-binding domain-containing protein [Conexibacter sp. SYSU D00693]
MPLPCPKSLLPLAAALAVLPVAPASAHVAHTVAPGETLSGIAAAAGVSTAALASANGLAPDAFAIAGATLQVPDAGTAAAAAPSAPASTASSGAAATTGGGGHLVRVGETLSGIAAANGLSTAALAAANGLQPDAFVIEGTTLRIPPAGTSTAQAAPGTASAAAGSGSGSSGTSPISGYRVRLGDTLSAVAARHGVSTSALAAANGLAERGVLLAGTVLRLPGGGTAVASPPTVSSGSSSGAGSASGAAGSGGPSATPGRVTASEISSIAAEHGVPGSLAAAIAWQESGFNNAMTSVADARGVMQILPGTWEWINGSLAGGRRLDPGSAQDNVRAGSLFLGQLLRETGGDPAMAAAGYYQGLASVRRIGMLPSTKQYVANVLALRSRFGG